MLESGSTGASTRRLALRSTPGARNTAPRPATPAPSLVGLVAASISLLALSPALAQDFRLGITGPSRLEGDPGETVRGAYTCSLDRARPGPGARAYTIALTALRGELTSITVAGTDAQRLLQRDGFVNGEIVEGRRGGAVLSVALCRFCPVTLPTGRPATIALLRVATRLPDCADDGGAAPMEIRYADGVENSLGTAIDNEIIDGAGRSSRPALSALEIERERLCPEIPELAFIRGDSNLSGTVDLSDAINVLNALFFGTGRNDCRDAADANDDGSIDLSDALFLIGNLFLGGQPPPAPGRTPDGRYPFIVGGFDPTPDFLGCELYGPCNCIRDNPNRGNPVAQPAIETISVTGALQGARASVAVDLRATPDAWRIRRVEVRLRPLYFYAAQPFTEPIELTPSAAANRYTGQLPPLNVGTHELCVTAVFRPFDPLDPTPFDVPFTETHTFNVSTSDECLGNDAWSFRGIFNSDSNEQIGLCSDLLPDGLGFALDGAYIVPVSLTCFPEDGFDLWRFDLESTSLSNLRVWQGDVIGVRLVMSANIPIFVQPIFVYRDRDGSRRVFADQEFHELGGPTATSTEILAGIAPASVPRSWRLENVIVRVFSEPRPGVVEGFVRLLSVCPLLDRP